MNDKNFSDKLEAFGTLGANVPTKTDAAVLPSISPQERELAQVFTNSSIIYVVCFWTSEF
jgi:hypothetical protein